MEEKNSLISGDLSIEKSSILPLKFIKIVYENGEKEEVVNFNNIVTVITDDYNNVIICMGKKTEYYYVYVVDLDKFEEKISKFMTKIKNGFYVGNLNDIKLIRKIKNDQYKVYFTSKKWCIYPLTKSEASALGF